MNDPAIFKSFLEAPFGVNLPRVRNLILEFIPNFDGLLAITDEDLDTFVKEAHSANTARTVNARILIEPTVTQGLKSVMFELKYRELCNDLLMWPPLMVSMWHNLEF